MIAKKKSHKGYYPAAGHDRKLPDTAKNPRFSKGHCRVASVLEELFVILDMKIDVFTLGSAFEKYSTCQHSRAGTRE